MFSFVFALKKQAKEDRWLKKWIKA